MDLNLRRPFNFALCSLFIITILCILKLHPLSQMNNVIEQIKEKSMRRGQWLPRDFSSCSPVKNIAYLKVHKTASSSIQNILFRYGIKNNLHFALPKEGNYFGMGIPFNSKMIPIQLIGNFDINIFAIHTKWDYEQVKNVMPKDTIFIASIREPLSLFGSLFTYVKFEEKTGLSFEDYVRSTPININRLDGFLGFNQMIYDFGLFEKDFYNETAIQNLINEADKQFDLVLSADKFEESLILLRHLLCWSYEDIVALKTNVRINKYKSKPINKEINNTLQEQLSADIHLYEHFDKKLELLIAQLGKENMANEIEGYRKTVSKIKKRCNIKYENDNKQLIFGVNKPNSEMISGYSGNFSDTNCQNLILDELIIIDHLRKRQEIDVRKTFGLKGLLKLSLPLGSIPLENYTQFKIDNKKG